MVSEVLRQAVARSRQPMVVAALALLVGTAPAAAQDPAPAPAAAPAPATDIVKRGELFGDWGGARTKMGQKGTKIGASYTQFFDWVPGRRRRSRIRLRRQARRNGAEQPEQDPVGGVLRHRPLRDAVGRRAASRRRHAHPDEHGAALSGIMHGTHAQLEQPVRHAGLRQQVRAAVRPLQHARSLQRSPVHRRRAASIAS